METQPKPWYASYKLIAAAVGLVLIFVNAALNHQTVDNNTVTLAVMGVISAYVASKAWEDGQQAQARATVAAANVTAAAQTPTTTVSTPGSSDVTVSATPDVTPIIVPASASDTVRPQPVVKDIGLV